MLIGGPTEIPILNFLLDVLKNIVHHIYIGSPRIGGKVAPNSIVYGCTEAVINGKVFRAHPCYSRNDVDMIGHILNGTGLAFLYQHGL